MLNTIISTLLYVLIYLIQANEIGTIIISTL